MRTVSSETENDLQKGLVVGHAGAQAAAGAESLVPAAMNRSSAGLVHC